MAIKRALAVVFVALWMPAPAQPQTDFQTALETYRLARSAFTMNGIPTESEINEYLKADAELLGLPATVPVSRVFDFSLQRDVNQELGVK